MCYLNFRGFISFEMDSLDNFKLAGDGHISTLCSYTYYYIITIIKNYIPFVIAYLLDIIIKRGNIIITRIIKDHNVKALAWYFVVHKNDSFKITFNIIKIIAIINLALNPIGILITTTNG